jgi:hypothetical protein
VLGFALQGARSLETADGMPSTGQRAVRVALAAVSRARVLAEQSQSIRTMSRALLAAHEAALADCRRSYADLREAVIGYTRELRGAGVPPDRALEMIKGMLRNALFESEREPGVDRELEDAVEWCLQAYYAA